MRHYCISCGITYQSTLYQCPKCTMPREAYIATAQQLGVAMKKLILTT